MKNRQARATMGSGEKDTQEEHAMRMLVIGLAIIWLSRASAGDLPKRYTETITTKEEGKKLSFDMVLVPGGTFVMGSPEGEKGRGKHEGPQRKVTIKPFYMATTETTFEIFMEYYRDALRSPRGTLPFSEIRLEPVKEYEAAVRWPDEPLMSMTSVYGDITNGWGGGKRPAMGLTWLNAMTYCKWLRQKTGKHYRLPTEAEWEYACRAGTTTPYFTGTDPDAMDAYAWYEDNFDETTEAVGQKKPNPFGLYDIQGNVREWVFDFYSPNAYTMATGITLYANPGGPAKGIVHVARGGAYDSPVEELRSAARFFETPWWRAEDPQEPKSRWWLPKRPFIGFRVAREIENRRGNE